MVKNSSGIEIDSNGKIVYRRLEFSQYDNLSLDDLFSKEKVVETITIGGKKYSKEEVEDRLKDLKEV